VSETATKLLEQLLALPEEDRAAIADQLNESLGDLGDDLDPEFEAELQRRLDSVADGTAELIDGEQVFREARERIQKRRQS
jgi:putative addiction module component (TIGR02574 family)